MEAEMRSALIVTVPESEDAVGTYRAQFDDAAAFGVPAHVTVLFPFMAPSAVDKGVTDALSAVVSTISRFQASFERTGWFGTSVLWLEPEPVASFAALIDAVASTFPDYPPFEGRHEVVIPHLTVGHDVAPGAGLDEAEARVKERLPIHADVTEVELWCGADMPGGWHRMMGFPLG